MDTIIKLIANAYSEMQQSGKTIYLKKYIKSITCSESWDFPFSIKEAIVDENHEQISVHYEGSGGFSIKVEQGWVSRISNEIHSIGCIGMLEGGERRQIEFCFSN